MPTASSRISSQVHAGTPVSSGVAVVTAGTTVRTMPDFGLSWVMTAVPVGVFHSVVPSHTEPRAT